MKDSKKHRAAIAAQASPRQEECRAGCEPRLSRASKRFPGPRMSGSAALTPARGCTFGHARFLHGLAGLFVAGGLYTGAAIAHEGIEEITVWGEARPIGRTSYSSPATTLTPEDLVSINAVTTEDLVKYEPGLVVRRRYIGDANGTLGMRGSNMFQTTRTMVFADGIPLHYYLQTQWNGAPRWALVGADEVARIDVIYGPFSAEYSGNAMGGVINIETAIPTERQFHARGTWFVQDFDHAGFDEDVDGYKGFFSYGDRFGDLSVYASYNRLENDSQPMDFLFAPVRAAAGGEQDVTGADADTDEFGNPVAVFGDTGIQEATTDQWKLKVGYEMGDWLALVTAAYEIRDIERLSAGNYLRDAAGNPVFNGTVMQDGLAFDVRSRDFAVSDQDRESLLLGGRVQGPLTEDWWLEVSLSYFGILEDETRTSLADPRDPAWTPAGGITDYDEANWKTAEVRLETDSLLGNPDLSLVTGYRFEHYELEVSNWDSANYAAGVKTALSNQSGGETEIHALYAQLGWRFLENWDVALGGRYEWWSSDDGFFNDLARGVRQQHRDRSVERFSPKFSLGFSPDPWRFRYSLAKAYRFPIVEELFQNEFRTTGTALANASLRPEDGLHHNLMLEYLLGTGSVRVNLFYETIDDVIFSQVAVVRNQTLSTFLPIDEVETKGVEFIYDQVNLFDGLLDVRFNAVYTDAEITRNRLNPAIEGNTFPRMPKWRTNLLLTWHVNDRWDIGGSVSHASDSYGRLDNLDTASEVYGAHDAYTFVNLRTSFRVNQNLGLGLGVDNVMDDRAFVHHPWPGRTAYLEGWLSF